MFGARAVTEVQRLAFAAAEFAARDGRWPSHAELLALDPSLPRLDVWRHPFAFDADESTLTVRSAGLDGIARTDDDVLSTPMHRDAAPK